MLPEKARLDASPITVWRKVPSTFVTQPILTGRPVVGERIEVVGGSTSPSDAPCRYRWFRDDTEINPYGYPDKYMYLWPEDVGHRIAVKVVCGADGKRLGARASLTTAESVTDAPVHPSIEQMSPPVVTGSLKVGSTLTVAGGTFSPADVSISTVWLRDGRPISEDSSHPRRRCATSGIAAASGFELPPGRRTRCVAQTGGVWSGWSSPAAATAIQRGPSAPVG
ncbi:MAG: hypothetical protein ABWY58_09200 [Aeromicrobium sp.]